MKVQMRRALSALNERCEKHTHEERLQNLSSPLAKQRDAYKYVQHHTYVRGGNLRSSLKFSPPAIFLLDDHFHVTIKVYYCYFNN